MCGGLCCCPKSIDCLALGMLLELRVINGIKYLSHWCNPILIGETMGAFEMNACSCFPLSNEQMTFDLFSRNNTLIPWCTSALYCCKHIDCIKYKMNTRAIIVSHSGYSCMPVSQYKRTWCYVHGFICEYVCFVVDLTYQYLRWTGLDAIQSTPRLIEDCIEQFCEMSLAWVYFGGQLAPNP